LEFCEKKGPKDGIYDLGTGRNFRNIFGCNPIFWCFPISKYSLTLTIDTMDQKDMGMFFEHKKAEEARMIVKTHIDHSISLTPPPADDEKENTATTNGLGSNGNGLSPEPKGHQSKTLSCDVESLI
jgi:hypothetical protein